MLYYNPITYKRSGKVDVVKLYKPHLLTFTAKSKTTNSGIHTFHTEVMICRLNFNYEHNLAQTMQFA